MVRAGADMIAISDPTATGEILGRRNFEEFAVPFYQELISSLHKEGIPVIFHICGNARNLVESLNDLNGNTQLLHTGDTEKIVSITRNAIHSGVDIVAPACGLSMANPVSKLRAMTHYVKEGLYCWTWLGCIFSRTIFL